VQRELAKLGYYHRCSLWFNQPTNAKSDSLVPIRR
jgi:hypothetical protein